MTRFPVTPGSIFLDKLGISYVKHLYDYQRKGSDIAAEGLGVDLHSVVKTLIMQREDNTPFIMLMHGDKEVSLKELARQIGAKNVLTSEVKDAQKHTGYMVGGISPFGSKKRMPIYAEKTILSLQKLYINGGLRGFIFEMEPNELVKAINPIFVNVSR
ncbi:Cys-tRNA(Pro) deacylase [Candidatus Bathyarchaeota archaeon]|nr:Cys-tRNA(Pro) deacylase [Candidatus Bathyarchaeota archaeon]